ncbi:MAG TPA: carboxypeptidase-like regulatory domain-containing protein [Gemmataceae bacterium]|nr:carboxypeptidase-like regulatory domain-containing protein [Gemmataceae bacterium]
MPARSFLVRAGLFVALVALAGCGGKSGLATVSGVVTHNGTPVEGATVAFHSTVEVEGKKQPSYAALTDSSGKYVIASVGKEPGIPPGLYKVTVTKLEGKATAAPTTAEGGPDPGQLDAQASDTGAGGKGGGPVNLLPKEYATLGSTKLSATLDIGKNENVNFDLKGK